MGARWIARNAWAPPRATSDLDLTIVANRATIAAATSALQALGYTLVREQRVTPEDSLPDILVFRSSAAGLAQVDVLVAKSPFEEDVLTRAETIVIDEQTVPVASPEALIVYKPIADRPRDREDIRAIVRTQTRAGRKLDWKYIEQWAAFWKIGERLERLRREIDDA